MNHKRNYFNALTRFDLYKRLRSSSENKNSVAASVYLRHCIIVSPKDEYFM